jgi:hypothetical protein
VGRCGLPSGCELVERLSPCLELVAQTIFRRQSSRDVMYEADLAEGMQQWHVDCARMWSTEKVGMRASPTAELRAAPIWLPGFCFHRNHLPLHSIGHQFFDMIIIKANNSLSKYLGTTTLVSQACTQSAYCICCGSDCSQQVLVHYNVHMLKSAPQRVDCKVMMT